MFTLAPVATFRSWTDKSALSFFEFKFLTRTRTWSNQLLKFLLMKMFSNHSDFCFDVPIHEILDQKSLYGQKKFVSEKKKTLLKFLKKNNFFQNRYWGGTVGELFAYIFGIYKKFGYNNPSILAPCYLVTVAT